MVTLYTTHCPKCMMLEALLKKQNIKYSIIDDKDVMIDKGFTSAPNLEVNGEILDYVTAMKWIKNNDGGIPDEE